MTARQGAYLGGALGAVLGAYALLRRHGLGT